MHKPQSESCHEGRQLETHAYKSITRKFKVIFLHTFTTHLLRTCNIRNNEKTARRHILHQNSP